MVSCEWACVFLRRVHFISTEPFVYFLHRFTALSRHPIWRILAQEFVLGFVPYTPSFEIPTLICSIGSTRFSKRCSLWFSIPTRLSNNAFGRVRRLTAVCSPGTIHCERTVSPAPSLPHETSGPKQQWKQELFPLRLHCFLRFSGRSLVNLCILRVGAWLSKSGRCNPRSLLKSPARYQPADIHPVRGNHSKADVYISIDSTREHAYTVCLPSLVRCHVMAYV